MKLMLGTALAAALLTLAGCGGDARPTVDEVATAIQDESGVFGDRDLAPESADCLAKILVESDLSDEALNAIVENDQDYEGDKDDEKVLSDLSSTFADACAAE